MPIVKYTDLSDDPEELEEREFYDGPCPPKGMYRVKLRQLMVKVNRNDADMLTGLLEICETRPSKKQYNGYALWFNRNITPQGERFLKNFLEKGLGVSWKTFLEKGFVTDSGDRPANIVSIGRVKIEREPEMVVIARRRRQGGDADGDWELQTDDFAPAFPGIDPKSLSDDGEVAEDDEPEEEDPFEEEPDPEPSEDEGEDEEPYTRDELEGLKPAELRDLAKEYEVYKRGMSVEALIDAILDVSGEDEPEEEEPEEEPEPEPPSRARKAVPRTAPARRARRA